ncbi:MAG: hypothetical protein Q9209_002467 [Squamulea sp. 1 TL-2023]
MPSNSAAWLVGEKVHPLEIEVAPYTLPGDNEILIKNASLAINPADWVFQALAIFPLQYPTILGADIAGEVVEVGNGVLRFRKGDRVLALATGMNIGVVDQPKSHGGFQEYTIIEQKLASIIPDSLSFELAAVLPVGIGTAAVGLYQEGHLHLQPPSISSKPNGQALLVWGGASSVGSNAIQLAIASGYEVATTASSKNFEYVEKLGVSQIFDYTKPTVIEEIVSALDGKHMAGVFDAINQNGAIEKCLEAASRLQGNKFVATVRQPPENIPSDVSAKFLAVFDIKDSEVSKLIYEDYLPKALAEGKYIIAPDPYVVGKGLQSVQAGIDMVTIEAQFSIVILSSLNRSTLHLSWTDPADAKQ